MLLKFSTAIIAFAACCAAQLTSTPGPTTSLASKSKICNILSYGAKADGKTDVGPAILRAFNQCAKAGNATLYIPPGNYLQSTFVNLRGGAHYAFQLDGVIRRKDGPWENTMIIFTNATDLEVFSKTSKGVIQGAGYEINQGVAGSFGPRMLRFTKCSSFSLHDLALIDAPSFTLVVEQGTGGELYNLVIRAGDQGRTDGIDISGKNHWVHDVEVTNRDECVTIKSPASNILVEQIYCNQSGGSAIGSLTNGTAISNIVYRNIYNWKSNQMMMIKSNGGDGFVENVLFENFIGQSNANSFVVDQYWTRQAQGNQSTGVQLRNFTLKNWKGTAADGKVRSPLKILCSDVVPCVDFNITDFAIWTDVGKTITSKCRSAHGVGGCLQNGTGPYAQVNGTITDIPANYQAPKMLRDLATGFGLSKTIPIPPLPDTYFPGLGLIKPLMNGTSTH